MASDMENATVGRVKDATDVTSDSDTVSKKKRGKSKKLNDFDSESDQSNDKDSQDLSDDSESDDNQSDLFADDSSNDSDDDNGGSGKNSLAKTASKVGTAVQGAQAVHKAIMLAKLLEWLKLMLQMLQQAITAAVQAVVGVIQTIVTAVVNVATAVATAIGVSVVATMFGGAVAIVLVVALIVGAVVGIVQENEISKMDEPVSSCAEDVDWVQENAAGDIDTSGLQLEYAKKVYSFYHELGGPDENIAGVLGNWSAESGIDPTRIECDYLFCDGEPYVVGPKKSEAFSDLNAYTLNKVFPAYGSDWATNGINESAYQASDGNYYCGLGLGQFTGPAGYQLVQTANSLSMDWYSLDLQLIYTVMEGGYRWNYSQDKSWFEVWFQTIEANPRTAADYFMRNWEGINGNTSYRQDKAEQWMVQFANWEIDADYANSLIELAGAARVDASNEGVDNALDDCESKRYKYDNSNIATAAVSYAWPLSDQGDGNNGTKLYQCVHDYIWDWDRYYASCCRGGSVAVRWSGSDDTFEIGGCANQFAYCASSSKWERVCDLNGMSYSDICETLAPGDILICDNCHTLVWTGNEIIKEIHGEESPDNYVAVEASYGNKSPVCIPLWSTYYNGAGSNAHNGGPHHFIAWRCVNPDNSDTYANAADGADTYPGRPFDPSIYT